MYLHLVEPTTYYTSLGCWKDKANRAIDGGYVRVTDSNPVRACFLRAVSSGSTVFAVQDGNACFAASPTAGDTYKKHGTTKTCANGRGGPWANSVYQIGIEHFHSIYYY